MKIHPVAALFPMMSEPELSELAEDIKINGLQHPVIFDKDVLLDGRNRIAACKIAGVDFHSREYRGNSPVAFIIASNLKRRHLSPSQKAALGVEIEPAIAEEARKRQLSTLKQGDKKPDVASLPPRDTGKARDQAAKVLGVSGRSVQSAKSVKEKSPELFEKIKKGEITVHDAEKKIKAKVKEIERNSIAEKGAKISLNEKWNIFHSDIKTWDAPRKYDFIITDPPYPKEFLQLWEILSKKANDWLKDGGLLIAMSGQSYLDEIYVMLCRYLKYYWTAAYLTPGQPTPLRQVNVNSTWKPLLIFVKGKYSGKIFGDVFKSPGNEKDYHKWGQSEGVMFDIISKICLPGQYILDPFCGAGTTGIAALRHGCLFDGVDSDIQNVNISKGRINDANKKRLP